MGFILNSIPNARDLGGYILPDGSVVREGLLLRGGFLGGASDADLSELHEKYRLAHVFDFRTEGELRRSPDKPVEGADNIWLPAIDPTTEDLAEMSLPKEAFLDLGNWLVRNASSPLVQSIASRIYTDMVTNEYTQLQYAAFLMQIVSTTDGAVYWHCSQGKDRTGLGAAFILAALGADRELILKDYSISDDYYRKETDYWCSLVGTEEEREVIRTFIGVNIRYFTAALDLIDRRWGSMDAYLRGPLCLTDEDITTLKKRYLKKWNR